MCALNVGNRDALAASADEAAICLRALSNPSRLLIVCNLLEGERSVSSLENELGLSQAYVSQQLARLRTEGFVTARREGRTVPYSIAEQRIRPVIKSLFQEFSDFEHD